MEAGGLKYCQDIDKFQSFDSNYQTVRRKYEDASTSVYDKLTICYI
ncbi:hypothetical protein SAMN05421786_10979 [Chryseobacterium ureilyticum]|uniref:Uncharacterized protein n=1 Tax=Chryseobacterium ureilyticum TaxID=373668 RepID=A0A1N7QEG0_9FLAO|nr:hypothetical protein SAMN05421786_10979 [Chryseobacterium ureilyticum]